MNKIQLVISTSALIFCNFASAGSVNTSLNVQANLVNACSVALSQHVDFGDFTELHVQIDNTFTIDVTCTNGGAYNIALDAGLNLNAGLRREIVNAASNAVYFLYQPGGGLVHWGDNDFGATYTAGESLASTGTGALQSFTGDARLVPSNPNSSPTVNGSHTDTVAVTVHY